MRRTLLLCCAACLLGAAGWLVAARARSAAKSDETLVPGKPSRGLLSASDDWRKRWTLDVPANAIALRCTLRCSGAELALHADWDELEDDASDATYHETSDGGLAHLVVDRFSDKPLQHGRLFLEARWEGTGAPQTVERRLDALECTLEAQVFLPSIDATLAPASWTDSAIAPHASGTRSFRIEPQPGVRELRIDLDRVQGDLDLYARNGAPVGAIDAGVRFARHLWGRESLLLGEGAWFVDVVDTHDEDGPIAFRIGVHAGAAPPPELAAIPALPDSFPGPLGRALPRVVELFAPESTGSGTLLSPDGWILTNAHVVTAMGGGKEQQLVVACTLDPHDPPLELFRAEVREFDETLDLALLQVVSGFYGQPLPQGYRFPSLTLGDPAALAIGDPVLLVGYPSTGGFGSLVTLHCTRGILSGFDHAASGMVLKTDAGITGGNSGGAALDEKGELVGIPTMMVELSSGQAGYVHPWTWMPESWRKHLAPSEKR